MWFGFQSACDCRWPNHQTVHYLKHAVYLKTWWNKVLVQISFDFEQETWTFKTKHKWAETWLRGWEHRNVARSASVVLVKNLVVVPHHCNLNKVYNVQSNITLCTRAIMLIAVWPTRFVFQTFHQNDIKINCTQTVQRKHFPWFSFHCLKRMAAVN